MALLINKVSDIKIEKVKSQDVLDQVLFCVFLNKGLCLIFYTKPIKFSTDTLSLLNTKAPSAYTSYPHTQQEGAGLMISTLSTLEEEKLILAVGDNSKRKGKVKPVIINLKQTEIQ